MEVEASDRNSPASVLVGLHSSENYGRRGSLEILGAICNRNLRPQRARTLRMKAYKLAVSDGPSCAFEVYTGKGMGDVLASQRTVVNLMGAADLFGKV